MNLYNNFMALFTDVMGEDGNETYLVGILSPNDTLKRILWANLIYHPSLTKYFMVTHRCRIIFSFSWLLGTGKTTLANIIGRYPRLSDSSVQRILQKTRV